jgi:hypothetical protein
VSKRFLLVLQCTSIFFVSVCFALDSSEYPWYFEPNKIEDSWKIAEKMGDGTVVDVWDTEVSFISILKGKEYFSESYISENHRTPTLVETIHATAVAGLIAGDYDRLMCDDGSKRLCDQDGKISVAGIAPKAKLVSRIWLGTGSSDLFDIFPKSLEVPHTPINKHGNKVRYDELDAIETKLVLANFSSGKRWLSSANDFLDSLRKSAKDNMYFLIVAGVGDDGEELSDMTGKKYGLIPACFKSSYFKNNKRDPIIRVGSTSRYSSKILPEIFYFSSGILADKGSNYGKDYVDVLAPGEAIPVLTPSSKAIISGDTSLSAAIVLCLEQYDA